MRVVLFGPLLLLVLSACGGPKPASPSWSQEAPREPNQYAPPAPSKVTGCTAGGTSPDAACTPGGVMGVSLERVCTASTRGRRHVTQEMKRRVFESYGLSPEQPRGAYEVDHLIPLELGGDNAFANLWPESAEPRPGFHEKDKVETFLHREVCESRMSLAEAQRFVATDWLSVWRRIEGGAASPAASDSDDD